MNETRSEIRQLQALLDESMASPGAHISSIFKPEHRLSAVQVAAYLQGVFQVAAATVTSRGEPRVAPIDAALCHGRFFLSTDMNSVRARHLARRPGVSLCYFEGADPLILVHGTAAFVLKNDREFAELDSIWTKEYGKSTLELSDSVVFIRVDPTKMFAYSHRPARFRRAGRRTRPQ